MQSIVLIAALAATFVFGFFVVRALGRFLDDNQPSREPEGEEEHSSAGS